MQIIAKTKDGFIIEATNKELKEIISSVQGSEPEKIEIGHKIPAIDYAGSIKKIKELATDYNFKMIFSQLEDFNITAKRLHNTVIKATEIE